MVAFDWCDVIIGPRKISPEILVRPRPRTYAKKIMKSIKSDNIIVAYRKILVRPRPIGPTLRK